jgi:hypothetical protein
VKATRGGGGAAQLSQLVLPPHGIADQAGPPEVNIETGEEANIANFDILLTL